MIRNLKTLGLALVAMMALGAVMASGASAQNGQLTSEGGVPFTLTGEEVGLQSENRLTAFNSRVQCPGSEYTGHKYEATPHDLIPNGAETVTITPHYATECTATALNFPATVTMNDCDYVFHLTGTTGEDPENTYGITATLDCPDPEQGPEVHVYKLGSEHTEPNRKCTIAVDPEVDHFHGLHATDETNGHIRISGTATPIKVTQEGPSCLSKTTTEEAATLDVNITVDADNEKEETIDIGISHD